MSGGSVVAQAALHPSGRWLTLPLMIAGTYALRAVLDTGSPQSALSPRISNDLSSQGLLRPAADPRRFLLADLTIGGQAVPDLEVGVLRRLDPMEVDGLLGLDFLLRFSEVHFILASLQFTFVDP
jgi:hypothetical protein